MVTAAEFYVAEATIVAPWCETPLRRLWRNGLLSSG